MNDFKHDQLSLINRSGMGMLPGVALAFLFCMVVMGAILLETWWALALVLAVLFVTAAVVVAVIFMVAGEEEEDDDGTPHMGQPVH